MNQALLLTVILTVLTKGIVSQDSTSAKNTSIWVELENLPREKNLKLVYYDDYFGKDYAVESMLPRGNALNILLSCLRPGTKYKLALKFRDTSKIVREFDLTTTGTSAVGRTWKMCTVDHQVRFHVKNDTILNFDEDELRKNFHLSKITYTCMKANHSYCTFIGRTFDVWLHTERTIHKSNYVIIVGSKPEEPVSIPSILKRQVQRENKSLSLEWKRDPEAYRYIIKYSVNEKQSYEEKIPENQTTYVIENMMNDVQYEIKLCAENKNSHACLKNPIVVIIALDRSIVPEPTKEPFKWEVIGGIGAGLLVAATVITVLFYTMINKICNKKHSNDSQLKYINSPRPNGGVGAVDHEAYFDPDTSRDAIRNPYTRGSQLFCTTGNQVAQRDSVYSMAVSEHEDNQNRQA